MEETRQSIYEWMLEKAPAFAWSEDGETGLEVDDLHGEAVRLFAHKVSPEHYREHGKDPDNTDDVDDFFMELVALIEESYY